MEKHALILTTTNDFLWKFERENVKILQRLGYVVHYAANMREPHYVCDEEKIKQMGVWTHHLDIARSPFLVRQNQNALRRLLGLIQEYGIQVLHCHTPVGGLLGRLAGKWSRSANPIVIYTAHGFHFYRGAPAVNHLLYFPVERLLARETDILIVINEEDYRNALKFRMRRGSKVFQIPGVGLDMAEYRPLSAEQKRELRERLGIAPAELFLVSVGELNENKNHRLVLEALGKLLRKYPDCSIRYGICGDGFLRSRLEQWIRDDKLGNRVTLYGYCPNVPEILGCADAAVFPSKREGLGMAGLEALAMGIPLIASDNRGTREYMKNGVNGFVFPNDNVEGLMKGIEALMSMDAGQTSAMAARCVQSAQPFDQKYTNAAMREIYADVDRRVTREIFQKYGENQHYHGCV